MKFARARSVLPMAIVALLSVSAASARHVASGRHPASGRHRVVRESSAQDLRAKLLYCKTCHGVDGQGFRGYYPIPRLAGQQTQYFENQMHAFLDHRRTHPVMSSVAGAVKPSMIDGLAANFSTLNPAPYGGAPKGDWALGKKIFMEGLPESNVPACFACHGPDAHGYGQIPRLAGQLYWYLTSALTNWTSERGRGAPDISLIMVPTTHNLTRAEVAALASYLSTLR